MHIPASSTHEGNIVDVVTRTIFPGRVHVEKGRVVAIEKTTGNYSNTILPGLIDAHVHIESSMLVPSEFARLAVVHGTVGTVSDPHEIANVLGVPGIEFMIANGKTVPFKFNFGAPPCVPATPFETSGASLTASDMDNLLKRDDIKYMCEMMNFPGVLNQHSDVVAKLAIAHKYGKPIDGHAPLLQGRALQTYVEAGITTDHEATNLAEAREKIALGMKIIIREGSAAKDFSALFAVLAETPHMVMFGSDDKHPDDLVGGHINQLITRAVALGIDPIEAIRAATLNPVQHYKLDIGLLQKGDPADFIIVDDLTSFQVQATYVNGQLVAENGRTLISRVPVEKPNQFALTTPLTEADFKIEPRSENVRVIQVCDGSLLTNKGVASVKIANNNAVADPTRDLLKIAVLNRYEKAPIALGFIQGFGIKNGAIASSVAHDSHNIVVVGTSDAHLAAAVNALITNQGGLAVVTPEGVAALPLPVAGIMSHLDGYEVADLYKKVDALAKNTGANLRAPFMTLSFMALLVIPHLKLGDKGLFDGDTFSFTELFV